MSPARSAPARLTAHDVSLRARYLAEVLDVLYPVPSQGGRVTEYLVVPDARRPRLLVPAADRRQAANAINRFAEPQTRLARLQRNAIVAALRTGASHMLLRDRIRVATPLADERAAESIETYLRRVLGTEYALTVHIGPARANRKPVLHLLRPSGEAAAVVKIGTTALTRQLVRDEAAALNAFAGIDLTHLRVPQILHTGQWHGHEVLIQSALPVWQPRVPLSPARLTAAMRELAGCQGSLRVRLRDGGYWSHLRQRLDQLTYRPDGRALAHAAQRLIQRHGDMTLRFGSWHGDWSPWNMTMQAETLLVWDWERFRTGVPVGFDPLHFTLNAAIDARGADATRAVEMTLRRAPDLLLPFGVPDPAVAEVITLLYLFDLAARYLSDHQAEAGARLGVLGNWLLPVLLRKVTGGPGARRC